MEAMNITCTTMVSKAIDKMLGWKFEIRYTWEICQDFLHQQYRYLTFLIVKSGMNRYKEKYINVRVRHIF